MTSTQQVVDGGAGDIQMDDMNDKYGILNSIRLVRDMVEKEFSEHYHHHQHTNNIQTPRDDDPDGSNNNNDETVGGSVDASLNRGTTATSQLYQLKQKHYEESKVWKEELRVKKEEIDKLRRKVDLAQKEIETERAVRTTLDETLKASTARSSELETQLETTQTAHKALEIRVQTVLTALEEQTNSITNERASSTKLVEELKNQKQKSDERAGFEEAGRLRAEAQRDDLEQKLKEIQVQFKEEKKRLEAQIQDTTKDEQALSLSSPSSITLSSADAIKALGIMKNENDTLKSQLNQIKSKYTAQTEELRKVKQQLQASLNQTAAASQSKAKTTNGNVSAIGLSSNQTKTTNKNSDGTSNATTTTTTSGTPSFEKAVSAASTLVASLKSQVHVMEKTYDTAVVGAGDDKGSSSVPPPSKSTTGAVVAAGKKVSTAAASKATATATATAPKSTPSTKSTTTATTTGKRPNPTATASSVGTGTGGGKKVAKKPKVVPNKK